jgi:branched-chain amino acid transport system substrate-binding protein
MQLKLKLTVVAAIAAVAGMASAQEQVVKIGHVAPVSGAQAHYGKDNENGARMAIEDLNAQGVTIGGKKIKFELQAEDDAADPKQGTAAAQKLCDCQGGWRCGSPELRYHHPRVQGVQRLRHSHVTGAATNPNLTKPGYKTTFRIIANDNALGAGLAFYAADTLKLKTVAIVDDRTAYGQGVADVFKKTAAGQGHEGGGRAVHHRQGHRLHGHPDGHQVQEP